MLKELWEDCGIKKTVVNKMGITIYRKPRKKVLDEKLTKKFKGRFEQAEK